MSYINRLPLVLLQLLFKKIIIMNSYKLFWIFYGSGARVTALGPASARLYVNFCLRFFKRLICRLTFCLRPYHPEHAPSRKQEVSREVNCLAHGSFGETFFSQFFLFFHMPWILFCWTGNAYLWTPSSAALFGGEFPYLFPLFF